jgi:hypothetical protein
MLITKKRADEKDSVRIEIHENSCFPTLYKDSVEAVELNIERLRVFYDLNAVTIVEAPSMNESRGYKIAKAKIALPTQAIGKDSSRNKTGKLAPDVFQFVEIVAIRDSDNRSRTIYTYKGTNVALNAEADAIVDSIQIICPRPTATPG